MLEVLKKNLNKIFEFLTSPTNQRNQFFFLVYKLKMNLSYIIIYLENICYNSNSLIIINFLKLDNNVKSCRR